jgi:hypothetical protein
VIVNFLSSSPSPTRGEGWGGWLFGSFPQLFAPMAIPGSPDEADRLAELLRRTAAIANIGGLPRPRRDRWWPVIRAARVSQRTLMKEREREIG